MSSVPAGLTMPTLQKDTLFQRLQPWLVVFSAALFFFFEFMQVNMFNALAPYLYKSFHLSDSTELGQLSACYMYANVIFLFPAGIILDRISAKRTIVIAMFFCVACAYLFSLTTALWQAEVCRLITGIGGAFCFLGCVRLASRWFPPTKMALIVGLVVTFAMIGGTLAQTPFTKMAETFGWRETLRLDAVAGMLMLGLIIIFVKDYPKGTRAFFEKLHASLERMGLWAAIKQTITNRQNWLGGIYASLINLPVFILGSTWGSWYLTQTQGLSSLDASYVTSMLFIGMIFGSPAIGWLSDRLKKRKSPMIWGALASLAVILAIMYLPALSLFDLMTLFFLLGFVISSQIIAYPLVAESNPSILTGESEGLASVLIMSGGFVIPLFPALLDIHWNHHMSHGIPFYALSNYHLAFMIMPIAFVIAFFAAFVVRDTRCLSYEENDDFSSDQDTEFAVKTEFNNASPTLS